MSSPLLGGSSSGAPDAGQKPQLKEGERLVSDRLEEIRTWMGWIDDAETRERVVYLVGEVERLREALQAAQGALVWRRSLSAPSTSRPT